MTAVQPVLDDVEPDPSEESSGSEAKRGAKFDALALAQLLAPVRRRTSKAQRIQLIASAATVVPFAGVVELGRELLAEGPVNTTRVWTIVAVVVAALLVRTVASGMALTITHFADIGSGGFARSASVPSLSRRSATTASW
jgi:ATP-binding cassette, subfamily B, bacterial IrtA/YbtP